MPIRRTLPGLAAGVCIAASVGIGAVVTFVPGGKLNAMYPRADAVLSALLGIALGLAVALVWLATRFERRRLDAERAASESELRYRRLVESSPDAVLVHIDGRIRFANPAAEQMFGFGPGGLIGRRVISLVHPDDLELVRERLQRLGNGAESVGYQTERLVAMDGSVLWAEIAAAKVSYEGVSAVQVTARDVTARRMLEERLRQAEKMEAVGQLAGGIAHDFNNILTAIGCSAQLAIDELPEDSLARSDVEDVRAAANRAAELTRQLLAFSRRQFLQPTILDLNGVVGGMQRMLQRVLGGAVAVRDELADDLWPVSADAGQMEQVLLNLAVNARDAMDGCGALTISTGNVVLAAPLAHAHGSVPAGDYVTLAVRDTGRGVSATAMPRLFEPFFTTKPMGSGTGLGLATVHGIVHQSGGHVTVDSEEGKGSRFTVYIPRAIDTAVAEEPSDPVVDAGAIVLVVDDDASVRAIATRVLERDGYTVLAASDGATALALADEHRGALGLVISDLVMPGMDGRELGARLAEEHPDLPVIYMSGYTEDELFRDGLMESRPPLLAKPFDVAELVAMVRARFPLAARR